MSLSSSPPSSLTLILHIEHDSLTIKGKFLSKNLFKDSSTDTPPLIWHRFLFGIETIANTCHLLTPDYCRFLHDSLFDPAFAFPFICDSDGFSLNDSDLLLHAIATGNTTFVVHFHSAHKNLTGNIYTGLGLKFVRPPSSQHNAGQKSHTHGSDNQTGDDRNDKALEDNPSKDDFNNSIDMEKAKPPYRRISIYGRTTNDALLPFLSTMKDLPPTPNEKEFMEAEGFEVYSMGDIEEWWYLSLVDHALAAGIYVPPWDTVELDNVMGPLWKTKILTKKKHSQRRIMSDMLIRFLRKPTMFSMKCDLLKMKVKNARGDGYLALYNIISLFHPKLQPYPEIERMPVQNSSECFDSFILRWKIWFDRERLRGRLYHEKEKTLHAINSVLPHFQEPFSRKFHSLLESSALQSHTGLPASLTLDHLANTLNSWANAFILQALIDLDPNVDFSQLCE